jgi:hypothetical protein
MNVTTAPNDDPHKRDDDSHERDDAIECHPNELKSKLRRSATANWDHLRNRDRFTSFNHISHRLNL